MPLKDYLNIMSERTKKALNHIQELRKADPELAAQEDERFKQEQVKKQEDYIKRRMSLNIAEKGLKTYHPFSKSGRAHKTADRARGRAGQRLHSRSADERSHR